MMCTEVKAVSGEEGKVNLETAEHPSSVEVNKEFAWRAVGHVNGTVENPAVGYYYRDGPADYIVAVIVNGEEFRVPKGSAAAVFRSGQYSTCTRVDSSGALRGAKFIAAGTYTIGLVSGVIKENRFYVHDLRAYTVNATSPPPPSKPDIRVTDIYAFYKGQRVNEVPVNENFTLLVNCRNYGESGTCQLVLTVNDREFYRTYISLPKGESIEHGVAQRLSQPGVYRYCAKTEC